MLLYDGEEDRGRILNLTLSYLLGIQNPLAIKEDEVPELLAARN
jgi:hypothetical protein